MNSEKMRIYLASPLFNESERQFNRSIRDILSFDFQVFLPQEDGLLLENLIKSGVAVEDAESAVYEADINAMNQADILIAVLDGATVDEGVAFELGYCKAQGKICVGLQTDVRRRLPTGNNPMINQSCKEIFHNIEELIEWLRDKDSFHNDKLMAVNSNRTLGRH